MTYTLYGSAGYNRFFKKSVAKQYVKDCAAVDCVPKGIIANTFPKKGFGIFTSDKEFVTRYHKYSAMFEYMKEHE